MWVENAAAAYWIVVPSRWLPPVQWLGSALNKALNEDQTPLDTATLIGRSAFSPSSFIEEKPVQQQPPSTAPLPPGYEIRKKGHFWRNAGIGCAGLIVLVVIIIIAAASGNHGSTPSIAAISPSNSAATAKASTAPAGAKVLLDKTGSGIGKTAIFTTSGEWEIDYTFDCSNFGQSGNFAITIYDGKGSLVDIAANQLAAKGSDTVPEHNLSGPYYLDMNSECDWHVIVKG
jgi:hypothetical protein